MSKKLIGLTLALALFAVALPASAAGLTQSQIAAIVALLQSFGAEQSVINNVSISLGGGTPGNSGNTVSCVELSYNLFSGSTDNTAGGQVTKLQRFLGVSQTGYFGPATEAAVQRWQAQNGIVSSGSPDSTGYGYVGAKTRAAMRCGVDHEPYQPPVNTDWPSLSFSPFIKAGAQGDTWAEGINIEGLVVVIKNDTQQRQQITFPTNCWYTYRIYDRVTKRVVFDLGSQQKCMAPGSAPGTTFVLAPGESKDIDVLHRNSDFRLRPGSYDMRVDINSKHVLKEAVQFLFNVAGDNNSPQPTASIDRDSLIQKRGSFALTGSAANVEDVTVIVSTYDYHSNDFDLLSGQVGKDGIYSFSSLVRKESWSIPFYWNNVTTSFDVFVFDTKTKQLLAKDKLKVVGENPEIPSGLIDRSSLESTSNNPIITGTAIGGVSAVMLSIGGAGGADSKRIPVVNGRWSVTVNNANFNPDDFGGTVRLPNGNYPVALRSVHSDGGASTLTTGTLVVKAAPTAPVIQSITPSWGPVGTEVIIRGTGFTGQNSVRFGVGGKVVSGGDGTYIRYTIPSSVSSCDLWTSSTICPPGAVLVRPSSYTISVSNVNGTSESKTFSVTSGTATPAGL